MQYRQLGGSGLHVSVLGLGTMNFAASGPLAAVGSVGPQEARRQLDMALDAGVNLLDTADVYSQGASEQLLGEVIRGRRDRILLATKVGVSLGGDPNSGGLSRKHILRSADASLARLGVDHIDLYQAHCWDGVTPVEEIADAFDSLVRVGKVRYVGVSNFSAWQLMKLLGAGRNANRSPVVSQQIHYSLVTREAEHELAPLSLDQRVGALVWSPLAGGVLTGKYRRGADAPQDSRRASGWSNPPLHDMEYVHDVMDVVVRLASERGCLPAQLALAYVLAKPWVSGVIAGARTEQQLAELIPAADLCLTADELEQLDEVSARPLPYPYWHQVRNGYRRLGAAEWAVRSRGLTGPSN